MKRATILVGIFVVAMWGSAVVASTYNPFYGQLKLITHMMAEGGLGWSVGDSLNFNMQMKPLPQKGYMKLTVTKLTSEGYTLVEDVNVAFLKQNAEILIDKDTGEIKRMIVNGKEQNPSAAGGGNSTMVTEEETKVTVPAGTFDAIHLVTKDDKGQLSEAWVNPRDIPINGILKTRTEQSVLEINTELVSFKRGH